MLIDGLQCGHFTRETFEELRRGDLVFFPSHVGLMVDRDRLIHASSHSMQVTIEPLADVVARYAADSDQPVLARKRLT